MEIEWLGNEKTVPTVGHFTTGDKRTVDDDVANDLINQGLAKRVNAVKQKPVQSEDN